MTYPQVAHGHLDTCWAEGTGGTYHFLEEGEIRGGERGEPGNHVRSRGELWAVATPIGGWSEMFSRD